MKSVTTRRFRDGYRSLPREVRKKARGTFRVWQGDPHHRSLRFKKVHAGENVFSVRIGRNWRALGTLEDDMMIWSWIGSHSEYDRIIGKL